MSKPLLKVISGGQTGVDRAALDAAIELGLDHGGWCPRGRPAEDGVIPARYRLTETRESTYPTRTRYNVLDSDGTLIIRPAYGSASVGTQLTIRTARSSRKPIHIIEVVELGHPVITPATIAPAMLWVMDHDITVLNVAGPRHSRYPWLTDIARRILRQVYHDVVNHRRCCLRLQPMGWYPLEDEEGDDGSRCM